jgi:hypothetical protein
MHVVPLVPLAPPAPPAPLAPVVPEAPDASTLVMTGGVGLLFELQAATTAPPPISVNVSVTNSFRVIESDFMVLASKAVLRGTSGDHVAGILGCNGAQKKSAMDPSWAHRRFEGCRSVVNERPCYGL